MTGPSPASHDEDGERPGIAVIDTTLRASGPPTLSPGELREEQARSLSEPQTSHPVLVPFFLAIDLLYGRRASIEKFVVLEHLAQIPYRSWERIAQRGVRRARGRSTLARRIQQRVAEARAQHDNEQWHMLVMEQLVSSKAGQVSWWRHRALPRVLALPWHVATWLLHLLQPRWSYRLNAAFEAHAERTYMGYVAAHPELDATPFGGVLANRWSHDVTVADVLRQIGHDERVHKLNSERAADSDGPAVDRPAEEVRRAA